MAINFDVSKCVDFQKHFPDADGGKEWNGLFTALTFTFLVIGAPDPKDMEEFWFRVDSYQRIIGALAWRTPKGEGKPEPAYATKEQIMCLKDLKSNIPTKSKVQFNAKFMEILRREHKQGTAEWM